MTTAVAVLSATGLFATWTLVTYLLEGRIRTLQRPDAALARLSYTLVANVMLGTVAAAFLIRALIRVPEIPHLTSYGLAEPGRVALMGSAAGVLGMLLISKGGLPNRHPIVLINAFAQTLVVSIAEVIVCWALFGSVVHNMLGGGVLSVGIAVVMSAVAFGFYHFAHSPPFNTLRMVLVLTGVGIATGTFFFVAGDIYSTILFHNFLALRGVTEALANADELGGYRRLRLPLIVTACAAALVLVVVDMAVLRPVL